MVLATEERNTKNENIEITAQVIFRRSKAGGSRWPTRLL